MPFYYFLNFIYWICIPGSFKPPVVCIGTGSFVQANKRILGSGGEVGTNHDIYFFACSKQEVSKIKKELNLYGESSGAQLN